ncbi:MAG: bifunctional 5,10-methylene-tetrahydrofolate dehydrogenase/5,10-methylene-tetrahydrofolate cyclohydrolase [Chloroflexi bacterium RBG_16_57_8]|nr:MAG: bifunctional 5,10-methylene-tetrahydrofolate dehydrogenase/5,10-methylene-tetrahydrofolate cyclohydrolase [Chloroflexi bacterium RBG_16_57_8]
MPAEIIDGRKIASEIQLELKQRIARLQEKGVTPNLTTILVGEDPASLSYLRGITRTCTETGVSTTAVKLPADVGQKALLEKIGELNRDAKVHGILLFLPLPKHLNAMEAESAISPDKDVDGTNPISAGKLLLGEETFYPSTPYGVQELLVRSGHNPDGKHVVIVGRSNIVGKPLIGILVQKGKGANATVTVCHTGTKDVGAITRQADILVAAMGKARAVTADMVREGTVVIDVGVNFVPDPITGKNKQVGDVDFEAVKEKASAITPVPGGTGAVTSVMLMVNTVRAAERLAQ